MTRGSTYRAVQFLGSTSHVAVDRELDRDGEPVVPVPGIQGVQAGPAAVGEDAPAPGLAPGEQPDPA